MVPKDAYIYLEEVEALKRFQFWPHTFMDIEKPASVSMAREFIWSVPLHLGKVDHSNYIKNYEAETDKGYANELHIQVNWPFHYRYQPISAE